MKKKKQQQPRVKSVLLQGETTGKMPEKVPEKNPVLRRAANILGVAICAFLAPILIINIILFLESTFRPDEVPSLLGVTPMVVVTDSMAPAISGGDMIVVRKQEAETIAIGDIISYYASEKGEEVRVITHRVMEIGQNEAGEVTFKTRGDANNVNDPLTITPDRLVGVYQSTIPFFGQAALFLRTVPGLLLCVFLPLVIFMAADSLANRQELRRKENELEQYRIGAKSRA